MYKPCECRTAQIDFVVAYEAFLCEKFLHLIQSHYDIIDIAILNFDSIFYYTLFSL